MAGSGSFEFSIPYDGELKKGLIVIGVENTYSLNPSIAIYNGNQWIYSNVSSGISSIELKDSILSFRAAMEFPGPYYISVFQTENFPTE